MDMVGILGTTTLSLVHALISLVGIGSGLVALAGWLAGSRLEGWSYLFLVTTLLTSVTGFFFPFTRLLPSHVVGVLSLIVLAVVVYARFARRLERGWRATFVSGSIVALYLNVFVLVVQLFAKVPALRAMAP